MEQYNDIALSLASPDPSLIFRVADRISAGVFLVNYKIKQQMAYQYSICHVPHYCSDTIFDQRTICTNHNSCNGLLMGPSVRSISLPVIHLLTSTPAASERRLRKPTCPGDNFRGSGKASAESARISRQGTQATLSRKTT